MKLPKGIGKNVFLLGLVSLLMDMSTDMIKPILPLYIAALGGTGLAIGLIGGSSDSMAELFKVFSGYLSDRMGKRKKIVVSGYSISAAMKFLLMASTSWLHVLTFYSLDRVGKGIRESPRDALIAETTPKKKEGEAFGIQRAMDVFGAVLGSLLSFLLIWYLMMDFKSIILIASIIATTTLVPLFFVKEKARRVRKVPKLLSGIRCLSKDYRVYVLSASLFALASFSYMFFILRSKLLFSGTLAIAAPVLLFVFASIFRSAASVPAGILSDKIGRKRVILAGYMLTVPVLLGFAVWVSLPMYIMLFAVWGIIYGLVDGNQRALAADLAPKELKGTALGFFSTAYGLALLPGGIIAGLLWELNPSYPFFYGAIFALLATVIFMVGFDERKGLSQV